MHIPMSAASDLNLIVDSHNPRLVLHPREPFLRSRRVPGHVRVRRIKHRCDRGSVWE